MRRRGRGAHQGFKGFSSFQHLPSQARRGPLCLSKSLNTSDILEPSTQQYLGLSFLILFKRRQHPTPSLSSTH